MNLDRLEPDPFRETPPKGNAKEEEGVDEEAAAATDAANAAALTSEGRLYRWKGAAVVLLLVQTLVEVMSLALVVLFPVVDELL